MIRHPRTISWQGRSVKKKWQGAKVTIIMYSTELRNWVVTFLEADSGRIRHLPWRVINGSNCLSICLIITQTWTNNIRSKSDGEDNKKIVHNFVKEPFYLQATQDLYLRLKTTKLLHASGTCAPPNDAPNTKYSTKGPTTFFFVYKST